MKSFIQFVSRSLFFFFPFSCQATETICSARATYVLCLFGYLSEGTARTVDTHRLFGEQLAYEFEFSVTVNMELILPILRQTV
jgi:hypothetical protein